MHTHRIKVFDRADDDAVVVAVTNNFHLVFFPADDRFLDQYFLGRAGVEAALDDGNKLFAVVGDAATGAAEREGRADDRRIPDHRLHLQRLFHAVCERRTRTVESDLRHRRLEFFAVLGLVDRFF